MEGDQLDGSKTSLFGDNRIISGVEIDKIGNRTTYWMFENHPRSLPSKKRSISRRVTRALLPPCWTSQNCLETLPETGSLKISTAN